MKMLSLISILSTLGALSSTATAEPNPFWVAAQKICPADFKLRAACVSPITWTHAEAPNPFFDTVVACQKKNEFQIGVRWRDQAGDVFYPVKSVVPAGNDSFYYSHFGQGAERIVLWTTHFNRTRPVQGLSIEAPYNAIVKIKAIHGHTDKSHILMCFYKP